MVFKNKLLSLAISTFILFSSNSVLAHPFSYDYSMVGKIEGFTSLSSSTTGVRCYVAVSDKSSIRSGYYHAITDYNTCDSARMAYALGEEVKLWAKVAEGTLSNDLIALEVYTGATRWWN